MISKSHYVKEGMGSHLWLNQRVAITGQEPWTCPASDVSESHLQSVCQYYSGDPTSSDPVEEELYWSVGITGLVAPLLELGSDLESLIDLDYGASQGI